jgi:hypothetical protein
MQLLILALILALIIATIYTKVYFKRESNKEKLMSIVPGLEMDKYEILIGRPDRFTKLEDGAIHFYKMPTNEGVVLLKISIINNICDSIFFEFDLTSIILKKELENTKRLHRFPKEYNEESMTLKISKAKRSKK